MVPATIAAIRSALVSVHVGAQRAAGIVALTLGALACSVYEPDLLPQSVVAESANGGHTGLGAAANSEVGGEASSGGTTDGGATPGTGGVAGSAGTSSSSGSSGAVGAGGCSGVIYEEMCWYLGQRGQSCDAACTNHGGVDEHGATVVGTTAQGGSLDGCSQVLETLGMNVAPLPAVRNDVGLGCHLFDADAYWLDEPSFTSDAWQMSSRIVCACRK